MLSTTETKTCSKCGQEKPLDEYPIQRRKRKDGTVKENRVAACRTCKRAQERAWAEANPDKVAAHVRKHNNTEKAKARRKRYNDTPKGKAAVQRYRSAPKGKAKAKRANKAYRERRLADPEARNAYNASQREKYAARRRHQQLKLTAELPTLVVKPFLQLMVQRRGTIESVAVMTGVDDRILRRILNVEQRAVSLNTADALALKGDFTLEELADRAEEWAYLTGDPWPEEYGGRVAAPRHSL